MKYNTFPTRKGKWTRTTRTPAFWDTPTAPWLPILAIHIRSRVKRRQSQSYKFQQIAKNSNFQIFHETLHATHLLKLLDKMCKYEIDPTRTVGATERTQDAGRTDGQTDRRTDGRSETNIPPTTSLRRVYNKFFVHSVSASVCKPIYPECTNIQYWWVWQQEWLPL